LIEKEFDAVTCLEMLVDHAFTIPLKLFWPDETCPVQVVPVCINTVQCPLLHARRVDNLGKAVGEAIQSWKSDKKVVVIGTGGLSHRLDGERAGFVNKDFDLKFMQSMETNPEWATPFSIHELVEKTGHPRGGAADVAGDAGRAHGGGLLRAQGGQQSQLPHPDLEHRLGRHGAGERGLMDASPWAGRRGPWALVRHRPHSAVACQS
jgi:hypothetical protein